MKTLLKPFLILVLLLAFALPVMPSNPHIITISGTSAKVAIHATQRCQWFSVTAAHGNLATSRFGDSTVSSSVGIELRADAGHFQPVIPFDSYTLSNWYVYVATGDTLTVLCAE